MKTTVKGICLNLNESEYYFKYKGLVFYFSSEFYKKKFADEISSFIETETFKIQVKYNININFDILLMISLYKKIEKRGFRIYDEETGEILKDTETTMSCILIDDNNKSYATGSKVFTIQMMRYLQMFGITDEGFEIKIVKNKTEKGNKSLGFELV